MADEAQPKFPPLTDAEADSLFKALGGDNLLLAVSGGPDSMALMHLVARWRHRLREAQPAIHVATVDHGLRAESRAEAEWVGHQAAALGLAHSILTWTDAKPVSGVQALARDARYRLLAGLARQLPGGERVAIVTGHQLEDQAETLLMRLARGSGLDGLAAMPVRGWHSGMAVLRPLLTVPKGRLIATLAAFDARWLDDPSNAEELFERVRVRKAWAALAAIGLSPEAVARSAMRLGRARAALDSRVAAVLRSEVALNDGLCAETSFGQLRSHGSEVVLRVLIALVRAFGGTSPPPRLARAEDLLAQFEAAAERGVALQRTLGGATLRLAGDGKITVWREGGRKPLPTMGLPVGGEVWWDRRFSVGLRADDAFGALSGEFSVGPLPREAWPALKPLLRSVLGDVRHGSYSRSACLTLPAIFRAGRLVAVPYFDIILGESGLAGLRMAEGGNGEFLARSAYFQSFCPDFTVDSAESTEFGTGLDE